MEYLDFVSIAADLEVAGLVWKPEIGDEISDRQRRERVSILVDPQGMTPRELRSAYLWLPSVEQMVMQFEARQAILFHAGLELTDNSICYKTVIKAPFGPIETSAMTLRNAFGRALRDLLLVAESGPLQ